MNVNIISQDDNDLDSARDSSIDIQELVAHQLERASEEPQNDEDFTSISSHKLSNNGLLLGIKYSTGEVTFSPFSYAKLDYPDEAACYILKNDVGYTHNKKKPGKYIAWARSFKREICSVVRQLFRLEKQETEQEFLNSWMESDNSTAEINITNPSNNGQTIPIVNRRTKYGPKHNDKGIHGTDKKKTKPGCTRRPVDGKYCVHIP